jgi:hypothetical protein
MNIFILYNKKLIVNAIYQFFMVHKGQEFVDLFLSDYYNNYKIPEWLPAGGGLAWI